MPVLGLIVTLALLTNAPPQTDLDPDLLESLDSLDRVAQLYRDTALRFSCNETLVYHGRYGKQVERYTYTYVYTDEHGLRDFRTARRSNDVTAQAAHAGLLRAYSWIFLFERRRRPYYRFQILGEGKAQKRPALIIGFEPVEPYRANVNEWAGEIWIDRESHQPLRVEADLVRELDGQAKQGGKRLYVTDFGYVKNGMRFPSRVTVRRSGIGLPDLSRRRALRFTQTYDDYRFFGVRTSEEVYDFVVGER